jgi:VWFA-related protein
MHTRLLVRLPLFLLACAFSQENPDTTIRITVNLVQVDAVVTDARNRQVTDLKASDFEIRQDGKPQKITHFSYISTLPAPAATPVTPPIARTPQPKNSPAPPPTPVRALRPGQVRRTVAMVVDDLGLSFESMAQVRSALKKFVDQQMQPGDLVAVIRTGAGMGALQQFTSDKRQLYAAVDRVKFNMIGRSGVAAFAPITGGDEPSDAEIRGDEFRETSFSVGTLGAINFVVNGLRELPGRKSVIIFSDNMRLFNSEGMNQMVLDSLQRLTDLCNRASVVLYTIDPRGLPTLSLTAADRPDASRPDRLAEQMSRRHQQYWDSQEGLNFLAQETGGLFVHDTNDISGGIHEVLEDQKGYYLIGYTPEASTFDEKSGRRLFHKINIRVNRPGLHVRSRNGFFGVPDQNARPAPRTRSDQIAAALTSPFGGGAIRLRLTGLFSNSQRLGSFVNSLLHIDAHDLTFTDEPDDWHKAVVDVVLMTFGDNGMEIDRSDKTFTIRIHGEEYKRAVQNGFLYALNHLIKKPGAYQLRCAVRDAASERVGSASQFIEVPDINKGRLAVSGIVLRSNVGKLPAETEGQTQEPDPLESPAVRSFKAGHALVYGFYVMNAQLDHETHKPNVETQLRLFRDGKQVYAGKAMPVVTEQQPDMKRLLAGGRLQLGTKMEPGDYVLQVAVTDNAAKEKYRIATQWMDFEVRN